MLLTNAERGGLNVDSMEALKGQSTSTKLVCRHFRKAALGLDIYFYNGRNQGKVYIFDRTWLTQKFLPVDALACQQHNRRALTAHSNFMVMI